MSIRHFFAVLLIVTSSAWLPVATAETSLIALRTQLEQGSDNPQDKRRLLTQFVERARELPVSEVETYLDSTISSALQREDLQVVATLLQLSGELETKQGNLLAALQPYQQALEYAESLENTQQTTRLLLALGNIYWRTGEYDQALTQCLKALSLAERTKNDELTADALHQLGIIHDLLQKFEAALEHHHRALAIREKINDQAGIADSLNNIGIVQYFSGKYEQAIEHYTQSMAIRDEIGDTPGVAKSLNNIGLAYKALEAYDKALPYFEQALEMREGLGDKYEVANISNNVAHLHIKKADYPRATRYLIQALQFAQEADFKDLIRENYELFSDIYSGQGNHEAALIYYKHSTQVKDEILNKQSQQAIADMQTKYDTEKQKQQIKLLTKDNEIQQLALDQQALLRNSLMGGLLFIIILAVVVFNRYRFERKANEKLEAANNIISQEKEKSDQLLLNILPSRVAIDLKETGKTEPESLKMSPCTSRMLSVSRIYPQTWNLNS